MEHLNADEKANKIRGLHAALSNDNTTPEGKEHAREQLKALGDKSFDYESKIPSEQHKDPANVAAGLKAAISNPNTSNEAKAEAEKKLYDLEHGPQGKNLGNVAGGLKAAMHNPNVSDEAKKEAEAKLNAM